MLWTITMSRISALTGTLNISIDSQFWYPDMKIPHVWDSEK